MEGIYQIQVAVSTQDGSRYLELDYEINDVAMNYQIPLIQVPNPVTGKFTFYFRCIKTGKKCRKLYLHEQYFQHRTGISKGYYLQTTLSKKRRQNFQMMKRIYLLEKAIAALGKKHFQSHYYGVHTKKFNNVMQAYKELKQIIKSL